MAWCGLCILGGLVTSKGGLIGVKRNIRSLTRGCTSDCTSDCTTLNDAAWLSAAGSSVDCGMYTRIGTLRRPREVLRRRALTLAKDA